MNSFLFSRFTMDPFSYSRIHYELTISYINSTWIYYLFREFTILFANSLWFNFSFCDINMDPSTFAWIQTWFIIISANWLWIHYFFRELTVNSLLFSRFTMDPLSFSRIHYELTINYINPPWIHYLFRKFTFFFANSLWFNFSFCGKNIGIQNWFLICSANSLLSFLRIHHPCREFIMISFSWYQYGSINFFVNS